jgi:hypothetical protein
MNLTRSISKSPVVLNTSNRLTSSYIWLLLTTPFIFIGLQSVFRTSEESKEPFQIKVEETYKKVVPCLRLGATLNGQYPLRYSDDLEAHYHEMLKATAPYRGLPPHGGSGGYPGTMQASMILKNSNLFVGNVLCRHSSAVDSISLSA